MTDWTVKDCRGRYVPWICGFCPKLHRCGYLKGGAELFDSSGDVVATYCGCGRLLEREDNYCSNCGAKVPRGDVE